MASVDVEYSLLLSSTFSFRNVIKLFFVAFLELINASFQVLFSFCTKKSMKDCAFLATSLEGLFRIILYLSLGVHDDCAGIYASVRQRSRYGR